MAEQAKSYPALLWHDIKTRKSEFFLGLFLSVVTAIATVYFQYKDGMLERKHFWDGIMTAAGPVLGVIVVFTLVEVYRAASSINRAAQSEIMKLRTARPDKPTTNEGIPDRASVLRLANSVIQFAAMRRTSQPPRSILARYPMDEPSAAELNAAEYSAETVRQYCAKFLDRVADMRDRLSLVGIVDERLELANTNPALGDNIQTIGDRLKEIAAQLPDDPVSDVAALHQANTLLKNELEELREQSLPRRLREDQQRVIAQVVRTGLHDLWERHKSSPSWGADDKESTIFIDLYSVESERETAVYRADFEKALVDGGLGVTLCEIVATTGERGNEEFVGVVSVLRGKPENLVRPFVLKALRSAGIQVNECDNLPKGLARYTHDSDGRGSWQSSAVTLVIGQRR
jgi:hypothetical protein